MLVLRQPRLFVTSRHECKAGQFLYSVPALCQWAWLGSASILVLATFLKFDGASSSVSFCLGELLSLGDKRKASATSTKDFSSKLGQILSGKKSEITRLDNMFQLEWFQNIAGFLIFSTFLFNLSPNLAKSSCGWSPDHLPHKIENR